MTVMTRIARAPLAAVELANIVLTTSDAAIAASPRDVVWSHRDVTLYRYRSAKRTHSVPILLVFALINTPAIFDLSPGNSLVEFLLEAGFDVFLLDWGYPDEEDADTGLDNYVCDELHWAIRETLRVSATRELTLLGWCMGATLCAMYCGLGPGPAVRTVRNLVLLTIPVDGRRSTYAKWVGSPDFDSDRVAEQWRILPGRAVDFANKLLKPVTNFGSTYRRLAAQVAEDSARPDIYQPMAKWVGDNPNLPGRAWAQWIQIMYSDGALTAGRVRLRGQRVDLGRIDQGLLVITADADHIAPRDSTMPLFDVVGSRDVTHFDRPGGHIGLVAGSGAKHELWPDIAAWLAEHSA
jgi:polyhydroxyalkanoate synthase subunit PhaC